MLTIIFTASLILIIAMIGLKQFEENKQKKLFAPEIRIRADESASRVIKDLKVFFAILSRKNAKSFALFIVSLILSVFSSIKTKLGIKKIKFSDSLRKNKNISKKKGPTSFFLKNVSEYKNNNYLK